MKAVMAQAVRPRRSTSVWAWAGVACGLLAGGVAFMPATALAGWVAQASTERVRLVAAQGSVWRGSATVLLSAGAGSGAPVVLPGRLSWSTHWRGLLPTLALRQDCCMDRPIEAQVVPGWTQWQIRLGPAGKPAGDTSPSGTADLGDWPAHWLAALGTPWNTLAPSGRLRLQGHDLGLSAKDGAVQLSGRLDGDFMHMASRLSTLPELGSYRLTVQGSPSGPRIELTTLSGALRLQGHGQMQGGRMSFQGQASASPDRQTALDNLLNIIGRRQGAVALLSIG